MIYNKTLRLIIAALMFTFIPFSVFADDSDGSGNGDGKGLGENKDIALTLENSSIKDNDSNVAVDEIIQLDFNKNICNVTVLANNKMCFHLTDEKGVSVPIKLVFPDDQVQQDYKRQAFIIPQQELEINTQYRLAVDNTLTAKNGTLIDTAHTITFTTGTKHTDIENEVLKILGDNIVTYETAYSETGDSIPVNKDGLDGSSRNSNSDKSSISRFVILAILATIIIFTTFFIALKRRK